MNGVQCNLYDHWLELAKAADYNLVWAPMDRELSDSLNMTAIWEFVDGMIGVDYGYEVVLTGQSYFNFGFDSRNGVVFSLNVTDFVHRKVFILNEN